MSNLCCNSFSTLDYNSLQTINGGDTKTGLELLGIAGTIVVGIAAVVVAPAAFFNFFDGGTENEKKKLGKILLFIGIASFLLISILLLTPGTNLNNLPTIIFIVVNIISACAIFFDLKKRLKAQQHVVLLKLNSPHETYLVLASIALLFGSVSIISISRSYNIYLLTYCLLLSTYVFTLSRMKNGICKDGIVVFGLFFKLSELVFISINKETNTFNVRIKPFGKDVIFMFEKEFTTEIETFFINNYKSYTE